MQLYSRRRVSSSSSTASSSSSGAGPSILSSAANIHERCKNANNKNLNVHATFLRFFRPVSTLTLCIGICYKATQISKSYSTNSMKQQRGGNNNYMRHNNNKYQRTLVHEALHEAQLHNEYEYVSYDGEEKLNLADNEEIGNPFSYEYDNCIIGSGLSGSVIAERYASQLGQTSLIIEKRSHIGGNCYDYVDAETNIRVSMYGAHLFHTKHDRVWKYVQQFGNWVHYEHKVLGVVNGRTVPIPVNIDTVNELFDDIHLQDSLQQQQQQQAQQEEQSSHGVLRSISRLLFGTNTRSTQYTSKIRTTAEMDEWLRNEQVKLLDEHGNERPPLNSEEVALTRVGRRLYEYIFKPYTYKQWAKYPHELGPEVLSRIPVRNNHDDRYFNDPYQALPKDGYTSIFERMLDNDKITVVTNTDYFDVKHDLKCKRTYYTGPIDAYFAHLGWPQLEYRSLSFQRVVQHDTPGYYQPAAVVNHPQDTNEHGDPIDYTRIVEYKHLLNQTSDSTIYFIERSTDDGEPYYPVPNDENKELYKRYQDMAEKEVGVNFVGRLANYKYFNMDDGKKCFIHACIYIYIILSTIFMISYVVVVYSQCDIQKVPYYIVV